MMSLLEAVFLPEVAAEVAVGVGHYLFWAVEAAAAAEALLVGALRQEAAAAVAAAWE